MNLESPAFSQLSVDDFPEVHDIATELLGHEPEQIFIDEIQALDGWERLVRWILDSYDAELFISGSSSKMLSKEIATQLRGRSLSYILLPFSFREFVRAKTGEMKKHEIIAKKGKIQRLFRDYMKTSTYPEVVMTGNIAILKEYFTTTLYLDFIERFGIENVEAARFLFEFIYQNMSREISIRKIYNKLSSLTRISKETVYKYSSLLPETMDVFFVEKFSRSVYERKSWPRKVYVTDHGMANMFSAYDEGHILENIVFLHYFRGINDNPMRKIYFVKTSSGREVDFMVVDSSSNITLVQVTLADSVDDIPRREYENLVDIAKMTKARKLVIVSRNAEGEIKQGRRTIKVLPAWRMLLGM